MRALITGITGFAGSHLAEYLLESHPEIAEELPELKTWIVSGETLPLELSQRFRRTMPDRTLLNLYGSSEVSVITLRICD